MAQMHNQELMLIPRGHLVYVRQGLCNYGPRTDLPVRVFIAFDYWQPALYISPDRTVLTLSLN